MNDLQIETRIAEIEGHTLVHSNNWGKYVIGNPYCADEVVYEPLTDDALCFQLMVKYDVELQITKERDKVDISRGKYPKQYYAKIGRIEVMDKVIERAILLCIIEAHKES